MEYRRLGRSGLFVSSLTLGTMTFGGRGDFGKVVGATDVAGARRQVDMCLEAGVNLFDTADIYSDGRSEEVLGEGSRAAETACSWPPRSACPQEKARTTPAFPGTTSSASAREAWSG